MNVKAISFRQQMTQPAKQTPTNVVKSKEQQKKESRRLAYGLGLIGLIAIGVIVANRNISKNNLSKNMTDSYNNKDDQFYNDALPYVAYEIGHSDGFHDGGHFVDECTGLF